MAMTNLDDITELLDQLRDFMQSVNAKSYDDALEELKKSSDRNTEHLRKNMEGFNKILHSELRTEVNKMLTALAGLNADAEMDLKTQDEIQTLVKQMSKVLKDQGFHKGKITEDFLKKHITYAGYDELQKNKKVNAVDLEALFVKVVTEEAKKIKSFQVRGLPTKDLGIKLEGAYQGGSVAQAIGESNSYKIDHKGPLTAIKDKLEELIKTVKASQSEERIAATIRARQFLKDLISKLVENKFIGGAIRDGFSLLGLKLGSMLAKAGHPVLGAGAYVFMQQIGKYVPPLLVALLTAAVGWTQLPRLISFVTTSFAPLLGKAIVEAMAAHVAEREGQKLIGQSAATTATTATTVPLWKSMLGVAGAIMSLIAVIGGITMFMKGKETKKEAQQYEAMGLHGLAERKRWEGNTQQGLGILAGILGAIGSILAFFNPIGAAIFGILGVVSLLGSVFAPQVVDFLAHILHKEDKFKDNLQGIENLVPKAFKLDKGELRGEGGHGYDSSKGRVANNPDIPITNNAINPILKEIGEPKIPKGTNNKTTDFGSNTEFGQRLANAIDIVEKGRTTTGFCGLAVGDALYTSFTGKVLPFDKVNSQVAKELPFRGNAADWPTFLRSKKGKDYFNDKGSIGVEQLKGLPAGTMVYWSDPTGGTGHIEIADGKGHLKSDFSHKEGTLPGTKYAGVRPQVFTPKTYAGKKTWQMNPSVPIPVTLYPGTKKEESLKKTEEAKNSMGSNLPEKPISIEKKSPKAEGSKGYSQEKVEENKKEEKIDKDKEAYNPNNKSVIAINNYNNDKQFGGWDPTGNTPLLTASGLVIGAQEIEQLFKR